MAPALGPTHYMYLNPKTQLYSGTSVELDGDCRVFCYVVLLLGRRNRTLTLSGQDERGVV